MAKNKISEFSTTAANNTDIAGINIAEGCAPSGINNAIRELMTQLKDQQAGTDGDGFTVGGGFTCTGAAVFSSTVAIAGAATAPTPTFADSSTKIATTAFVQVALAAAYPVGSIYINATSATNPSTLLGFGTWVAFGAGRVMVGLDAGNALFDTAEETGGSADATLPIHTHTATVTDPGHFHTYDKAVNKISFDPGGETFNSYATTNTSTEVTGVTVSNSTTGSSGANANFQPYITVRMWKRTA